MKRISQTMLVLSFLSFVALSAPAFADPPACMGDNGPIDVNNDQVIAWKTSTPNSFRARAHVQGNLIRVFPDHSGHHHFEVSLGAAPGDKIEIIYNEEFGGLPEASPGDVIEACGDYITSNHQAGPYPPSPDGAILHWVHRSPNLQKHASGYVYYNGQTYGQNVGNAGPKDTFNAHLD